MRSTWGTWVEYLRNTELGHVVITIVLGILIGVGASWGKELISYARLEAQIESVRVHVEANADVLRTHIHEGDTARIEALTDALVDLRASVDDNRKLLIEILKEHR